MDAGVRLEQARRRLRQVARVPSALERHLRVAAVITALLEPMQLQPIIVGGSAVEFYSTGMYVTADLDLIVSGLEKVAEVLRSLGFQQVGASFTHPEVPVVVDLPAEPLRGDRARVTQVAVGDGVAYVIGLEDVILDRLAAYRHWRDEASREWAVQLLAVQWDRVDWEYLERQAASADWLVGEALDEAKALARRARAEAGLESGAP